MNGSLDEIHRLGGGFDPENPSVITASGKRFHILHPAKDEICIEDIAYQLAGEPRFASACKPRYYVGEHCLVGSGRIAHKFSLEFLLHDSAEYIAKDFPSPWKLVIPEYKPLEHVILDAIFQALELPYTSKLSKEVKQQDEEMYAIEQYELMPFREDDNRISKEEHFQLTGQHTRYLECMSTDEIEIEFLARYYQLREELNV